MMGSFMMFFEFSYGSLILKGRYWAVRISAAPRANAHQNAMSLRQSSLRGGTIDIPAIWLPRNRKEDHNLRARRNKSPSCSPNSPRAKSSQTLRYSDVFVKREVNETNRTLLTPVLRNQSSLIGNDGSERPNDIIEGLGLVLIKPEKNDKRMTPTLEELAQARLVLVKVTFEHQ